MSRIALALLALALACGAVRAQTQSTTPTIDPGTKLNFAATVGGATFERAVNYGGPQIGRAHV